MTGPEAVAAAAARLAAAGVPTPEVDAEWLVAHVAGVPRSAARLHGELAPDQRRRLDELVARRAVREPLAYVLGEWAFRRLTLKTDARALVPRPETETVVERCLALLAGTEAPRVLDVGVGSGAIALAIADERRDARVSGVDISSDALSLARENAQRLGLDVALRQEGIEAAAEGWELVVSNPPYVTAGEIEALEPEVREFEPRTATVGHGFHEAIARTARTTFLVFEVGDGQAERVGGILRGHGYGDVRITRDLTGRERVVEGQKT